MPAQERLAGALVRALAALPPAAQRALAGRPVRIDAQKLDPGVQLMLRVLALAPEPPMETLPPDEARAQIRREAAAFAARPWPIGAVRDVQVAGAAHPLRARLYVPEDRRGATARPLLVYFHGGGWVTGDLDTHDQPCRFLAREAGVLVLAVDYRRAPEHRFPAAADDALAAFRDAVARAGELGADPRVVAVGGDSAGGNLALVTALAARDDGGPRPALVAPVYPVTDLSSKHPSYALFGDGFFLTEAHMDWYRAHYLGGDEAAARDPRASPLLAPDLAGLPPVLLVTAGFDPLRDEGEAMAARLREAGVAVAQRRHPGLIHGFVNAVALGGAPGDAMRELAGALRAGLALARAGR
ncbi:MAG TPA: alpha/beta hydrolase [Solirubrobacteraceae bacterium]|nr:alpha/beta hydrolase [Solirubrobacteraceae bacterium]